MTHKKPFQGWDLAYGPQAKIAGYFYRQRGSAKQAVQVIRDSKHGDIVKAAPALVVLKHILSSDIKAKHKSLRQQFGQYAHITETKVYPLPGQRVDAMRGVTYQRDSFFYIVVRMH